MSGPEFEAFFSFLASKFRTFFFYYEMETPIPLLLLLLDRIRGIRGMKFRASSLLFSSQIRINSIGNFFFPSSLSPIFVPAALTSSNHVTYMPDRCAAGKDRGNEVLPRFYVCSGLYPSEYTRIWLESVEHIHQASELCMEHRSLKMTSGMNRIARPPVGRLGDASAIPFRHPITSFDSLRTWDRTPAWLSGTARSSVVSANKKVNSDSESGQFAE
ncbi:uncharacterized protein MYCFIDRAFT_170410 [Pseudocercospora fijiensis CIRAD86]|uniref:Uncharacterized protein n=1 Tax=Pseudocercospora fijiensis (strain CIRAD86) TaxID=383855 RepID=N1Q7U7_PSEFD|nr:uncharacterized protein MYCFIDRAFT_170410 [Pseudocercospora fijiensis CIRAD86]EME88839.1 hypothetical protein MYCFIDRAFT_170410 [Pseudocercospora fijiensis CIRAD86]